MSKQDHKTPTLSSLNPEESRVVGEIIHTLRSLKFGSIEITVHDGKVTQIERKEKVRF